MIVMVFMPLSSISEGRLSEELGKQVIQIEVELSDHTDVLSSPGVDRDHGLQAQLDELAGPEDARVDGPGGLPALAPVQGGLEAQLDDGDHPVERRREAEVLHEGLEIGDAVFDRKPPL